MSSHFIVKVYDLAKLEEMSIEQLDAQRDDDKSLYDKDESKEQIDFDTAKKD